MIVKTPIVALRHPSCGLYELAQLMGEDKRVMHDRYRCGELEHLVMRGIDGSEWRPNGRIEFDAMRVRGYLPSGARSVFDRWQAGELQLGRGSEINKRKPS
jgi:hypothetical protein